MTLKMYILVRESVPLGLGVNSVGHTALRTYLRFQDDPLTIAWVDDPKMPKVTCVVTEAEFEKAQTYSDFIVMTEAALDGQPIALGFKPRESWPKFFGSLRLFGAHLAPKSHCGA